MIRETFRCHTGILWNKEGLKLIGLDADLLYPNVIIPPIGNGKPTSSPDIPAPANLGEKMEKSASKGSSMSPSTTLGKGDGLPNVGVNANGEGSVDPVDPEHHDALSPMFDQLAIKPWWWLLEILPVKGKKQRPPPHDLNSWQEYTL
jgi:hypothetical protein